MRRKSAAIEAGTSKRGRNGDAGDHAALAAQLQGALL